MTYNMDQEIKEAIFAGETALRSLEEAQGYLKSAGNWGMLDMFGGGMFTTFVKHTKIGQAKQCMETARQDLRRFQKELDDIDEYLPDIQIGDFITFADYFFDGIFTDAFVQVRINNAKRNVSEAIERVENIVNQLKHQIR